MSKLDIGRVIPKFPRHTAADNNATGQLSDGPTDACEAGFCSCLSVSPSPRTVA